jgi:hypothetical protein
MTAPSAKGRHFLISGVSKARSIGLSSSTRLKTRHSLFGGVPMRANSASATALITFAPALNEMTSVHLSRLWMHRNEAHPEPKRSTI